MNGVNEHVTRRSQQKIKKDERETEKKGEVMGGGNRYIFNVTESR